MKGIFIKFGFPLFILFIYSSSSAQSITEIITDYEGYWKSSSSAINPSKPNNNHNLLSFSFSGVRYSTGVNDGLLTSQGQSFIAGDYRALPVQSINGTINSNTKIGVGAMFDGVPIGPSNPPPSNNIPYYLTDGQKGLNIGTCVANLPAGTLFFSVGNISPTAIGDGVPDVVITQTADPSASSFDRYEFTDVNGNRIGNYLDIILTSITPVGNWIADFYEASTNPMVLNSGFTNTQRPIRLWAADFNAFGISATDISSIAYFKIALNGNSDVAFVAYNNNAINFSTVLPVQLSSFTASGVENGVRLSWQTLSEANTDRFTIETSTDGINFSAVADKKAAGYSSNPIGYSYTHTNPPSSHTRYYRLKQFDQDGKFKYSKIVQVDIIEKNTVRLYPNPANDKLVVHHKPAKGNEQLQIITTQGRIVLHRYLKQGTGETSLHRLCLPKGLYFVAIYDGIAKTTHPLMIQ
ncbi:MAG: T9SS type A sorting domain-containing protein [Chitinophagaceae bacterium]|nr:T9SS type A sorting domain-containing protein [Chitinophagaceae bacterium]